MRLVDGAVTRQQSGAETTMAEGPDEARGRPPGQGDGGGDQEPVASLTGPPAAAPHPWDEPQAEPQSPGQPPAAGLTSTAAAAEESQPQREPVKRGDAICNSGAGLPEPAGCESPEAAAPREKPARLSAREYSRQVHEWLWQSYCGYLTWHSGLAAFPAYCGPQPSPLSYPLGGGTNAPQTAAPSPLQLGYYNPFYFLSAAAAGPDPGAAPGISTPAPVTGLGPRAPHVQGSVRATPVTRVGSAAPSRTPSENGRQAGEKRDLGGGAEQKGLQGTTYPEGVEQARFFTCVTAAPATVPTGVSPCASAMVCPGLKFSKVYTERLYSFFFL